MIDTTAFCLDQLVIIYIKYRDILQIFSAAVKQSGWGLI